MTEQEWLTATDPTPMLESLQRQGNGRRAALFAVAACRQHQWAMASARGREALEWAEEAIEGLTKWDGDRRLFDSEFYLMPIGVIRCVGAAACFAKGDDVSAVDNALRVIDMLLEKEGRLREMTALMRDIFGNPFRPVIIDPSWLTSTVLALAEGIYQDRASDRMPILADALQDAGCENEDILNHCRQSGEHVRGCWVVDLLTGRK